ncbi:hypothetical protein HN924_03220 [Candidatus Woesearchaeota archaeon]|jgi:hypothetical protein|nr:hypothetical protein [Candidatus Woesearchaeota archaeon]MBT7062952.1 hypothetical protein [Candidatus Woesearchaeota archaeon]MBT7402566.1 hypothetical protein [Candidatus Woesearchaeota archaeon]
MNVSKELLDFQCVEFLRTIAYSSATSPFLLNGDRWPVQFGTNCCEEAKVLRHILTQFEFSQVYYLDDQLTKRHRSLLCELDNKTYYINPYFMIPQAIELDQLDSIEVDTFPIVNDEYSIVTLTKDGAQLSVTKSWPGSDRKDKFQFDISQAHNNELEFEDYIQRVFHEEQRTLSIRVLDVYTNATDHIVFPIQTCDGMYIKTNEGQQIMPDSTEFAPTLANLSHKLRVTPKSVVSFMRRSSELYIDLHQKHRDIISNPEATAPRFGTFHC